MHQTSFTHRPFVSGSRRGCVRLMRLFALLSFASLATRAWAGLTLCNRTPEAVSAVVAWFPNDAPGTSTGGHMGGTVHGWFKLASGECAGVDDNAANSGSFYWYAKSSSNRANRWDGTARLCVRSKAFRSKQLFLMGGAGCNGDWYDVGFRRIDTGATHYRMNITM